MSTASLPLRAAPPIFFYDSFDDISGTGEFNDHWNITGDPHNIHWSKTAPIPYFSPDSFTFDSNDEHVIGGNAQRIAAAFHEVFGQVFPQDLHGLGQG